MPPNVPRTVFSDRHNIPGLDQARADLIIGAVLIPRGAGAVP